VAADSKWQTETNVQRIQTALAQADVQVIARDDFQGKHLSWEKNQLYVDPSYLDSPIQAASKWIGEQVRTARRKDDELKKSDSVLERMIGTGSAAILDAVSAADTFVKDKIKVSYDYYNKRGGIIGELGRGATFVADQVSSVVTMPATIADYKASDEERAGAVTGTLILVGTAGLLKAGGPTMKAMGGRIAGSRPGAVHRQQLGGRRGARHQGGADQGNPFRRQDHAQPGLRRRRQEIPGQQVSG
jgi:hypothetical protein